MRMLAKGKNEWPKKGFVLVGGIETVFYGQY